MAGVLSSAQACRPTLPKALALFLPVLSWSQLLLSLEAVPKQSASGEVVSLYGERHFAGTQNHGMVGLEGTIKDHLIQHPCHGQGHLPLDQVAPSPIQPGLEHFQGWGSHNCVFTLNQCHRSLFQSCPRSPCPCPDYPGDWTWVEAEGAGVARHDCLCAARSAGHAAGPAATASLALTPAGFTLAPLLSCADLLHCAVHQSVGAASAAMLFTPKGNNRGGFSQPPTSPPSRAVPWTGLVTGRASMK